MSSVNKAVKRMYEIHEEIDDIGRKHQELSDELAELRIKSEKSLHDKNIRGIKKHLKGSSWGFKARIDNEMCKEVVLFCNEDFAFKRKIGQYGDEKIILTGEFYLDPSWGTAIKSENDIVSIKNIKVLVEKYDLKLDVRIYDYGCNELKNALSEAEKERSNAKKFIESL